MDFHHFRKEIHKHKKSHKKGLFCQKNEESCKAIPKWFNTCIYFNLAATPAYDLRERQSLNFSFVTHKNTNLPQKVAEQMKMNTKFNIFTKFQGNVYDNVK